MSYSLEEEEGAKVTIKMGRAEMEPYRRV